MPLFGHFYHNSQTSILRWEVGCGFLGNMGNLCPNTSARILLLCRYFSLVDHQKKNSIVCNNTVNIFYRCIKQWLCYTIPNTFFVPKDDLLRIN